MSKENKINVKWPHSREARLFKLDQRHAFGQCLLKCINIVALIVTYAK